MRHIRSYLTSRAVATGAAVVLLGGGAAIAVEGGEPPLEEEADPGDEPAPDEGPEPEAELQDTEPIDGTEDAEPLPELGADALDGPEETDPGAADLEAMDEEERSETARRVHEALSGDPAIGPGHPEFGAHVSKRARSGQPGDLGRAVSRAARDLDADASLTFEERERPARSDGNDADGDRPVDAGPPEGVPPGPPAHANARANRGDSRD